MNVEGKGNVAPVPVPFILKPEEVRAIFLAAKAELSRYGKRSDAWGRGRCAGMEVVNCGRLDAHEVPAFVGKLGEYATRSLLAVQLGESSVPPVDFTRRTAGDGGLDLSVLGMNLQVKTRKYESPVNLIRTVSGRGQAVPLCGDAHVFCKWLGGLWVHFVGWQWNKRIAKLPPTPARPPGDWTNVEVADATLLPLARLVSELKSRKE